MIADPTAPKRHAYVITGSLLAIYAVAGIVYSGVWRADTVACGDASQILIAGGCYNLALLLTMPLLVGIGLVVAGLVKYPRQHVEGLAVLHHGGISLFLLWLLGSLTIVNFAGFVAETWLGDAQATQFVYHIGDIAFRHNYLLLAASLISLAAFGITLAIVFDQRRRRLQWENDRAARMMAAPGGPDDVRRAASVQNVAPRKPLTFEGRHSN